MSTKCWPFPDSCVWLSWVWPMKVLSLLLSGCWTNSVSGLKGTDVSDEILTGGSENAPDAILTCPSVKSTDRRRNWFLPGHGADEPGRRSTCSTSHYSTRSSFLFFSLQSLFRDQLGGFQWDMSFVINTNQTYEFRRSKYFQITWRNSCWNCATDETGNPSPEQLVDNTAGSDGLYIFREMAKTD